MSIFKIRRGRHYSSLLRIQRLAPYLGQKKLKWNVEFSDKCFRYYPDHTHINKLCGVSFGLNHHKNSLRIGWRTTKTGTISLHSYEYRNGIRETDKICEVRPGEDLTIRFVFRKDGVLRNNKMVVILINAGGSVYREHAVVEYKRFGWFLFPYYGGKKSAPEDMQIKIDRI